MKDAWTRGLERIKNNLNWRIPDQVHCRLCSSHCLFPPQAGSYGSALRHFEEALGPLADDRSRAGTYLILLQDPRRTEENFVVTPPSASARALPVAHHRYFCLSPFAWRSLGLDRLAASSTPCWPTRESRPHFLRTYLRSRHWCYDAFLAYLLYLLYPVDAYVTNLAKCHFGEDNQSDRVFSTCAQAILSEELAVLMPSVVLSLTSRVKTIRQLRQLTGWVPEHQATFLLALHPRARDGARQKAEALLLTISSNKESLSEIGVDVDGILDKWTTDCRAVGVSIHSPRLTG